MLNINLKIKIFKKIMDINFLIQGIKNQINDIKFQIENIEIQNNNQMMMIPKIPIGDQLLGLSLKIFNTGIQTFNTGKNLSLNSAIFFNQLQNISEQINLLINSHIMEEKQKMLQQQMMVQQFPIMHQNPVQQNIEQPLIIIKKINVLFKRADGTKLNIIADLDMTMKDLLDKYMDKAFGYEREDVYFVYNMKIISRNETKKLKDYLNSKSHISIDVKIEGECH